MLARKDGRDFLRETCERETIYEQRGAFLQGVFPVGHCRSTISRHNATGRAAAAAATSTLRPFYYFTLLFKGDFSRLYEGIRVWEENTGSFFLSSRSGCIFSFFFFFFFLVLGEVYSGVYVPVTSLRGIVNWREDIRARAELLRSRFAIARW